MYMCMFAKCKKGHRPYLLNVDEALPLLIQTSSLNQRSLFSSLRTELMLMAQVFAVIKVNRHRLQVSSL